jgi:hypothetical protein
MYDPKCSAQTIHNTNSAVVSCAVFYQHSTIQLRRGAPCTASQHNAGEADMLISLLISCSVGIKHGRMSVLMRCAANTYGGLMKVLKGVMI